MPVTLQELRPDTVEKATAFAAGCGCSLKPGRVVPGLSVLATENDAIVAAVICVESKYRHRLELAHPGKGVDAALRRLLIDKALMKLRASGVRTCDLLTNGAVDGGSFWDSVSWRGQSLSDAA